MNTPAHVIFSLALLGRPNAAKYAVSIALGALLPDLFMVLFYGYEKLRGVPESVIWNEHYFLPFWQNLFDLANSIPLLLIALAFSLYFKRYFLVFLFASMIIHCLLDLPVHHDDGHRHFYPFSDFKFQSPLSYWDPNHYGNLVGIAELVLFFIAAIWLWCWQPQANQTWNSLTKLRTTIVLTTVIYFVFFGFVAIHWMNL